MFRRRAAVVRRPFFRRPRILGAALIGGLGFAAGRASKTASSQQAPVDMTARLKELADLHASGALTDAEFAEAKAKLLGS